MYPVSDAYLAARRSRVREERITGGIKLKDGTIIAIDDSVIIQNSLSISKKVCSSSKFDIGTMNCSVLEMKLVDDSAYDHEFGGALIRLKYGIVTGVDEDGNKVWEEVPLPPFFADGSEVTRKWNVITITAYDPISLLNIDYPDTIPTDSLYSALQYVCNRAGIGLAITEDEFSLLPNSSVKPDFSSAQVVSCLDVAMWIAQTVNCCGFVDHRGLLYLKQYNYAGGNNYDRLFTEDEIKDIKYSDTRTYLAYLQAYAGDKVKLYSKVTTWTGSDASHTKEGALSLPKNPILSGLTDEEQAAVNSSYLENRSYPTRYIKMTGWVDPALELMDVVAFSGKMIDVGQIINVATQIKWCYGKSGTIYCASVAERSETAGEASSAAVMALAVTEEETSNSINRVQPKSQIEKRLDAIEAGMNDSGNSASALTSYEYLTDLSAKFNGVTYTVEKDADTGLIAKISDSNGNEFEPTINSGITDVAQHNAVFWAVAMARGIGSPQFVMGGIFGMFTPDTRDIANSRWRNSISGYNDITLTGGSVSENAVHFTASQYGTFTCDEPNTVYAIVKSEQSEAINCIITKKLTVLDGSVNYGFNLLQYGGQMYFSAAKNDILQPEETALPNTEYHCYCYTRSGGTIKFYADGVFVGSLGNCNTGRYGGLMYLNNELFGSGIIDEPTVCDFVMCAFGSQYHDEATVQKNMAYLMKKYGL